MLCSRLPLSKNYSDYETIRKTRIKLILKTGGFELQHVRYNSQGFFCVPTCRVPIDMSNNSDQNVGHEFQNVKLLAIVKYIE